MTLNAGLAKLKLNEATLPGGTGHVFPLPVKPIVPI